MSDASVETLVERIDECRGTRILQEKRRLASTLQIVGSNRDTLAESYDRLKRDATAEQPPVSPGQEHELLRSFHNYLGSLYTLYEHGKRYRNKYFCTHHSGTNSCEQCRTENVERLRAVEVLPTWNVVKKLRVYTDHYRLPLLRGHLALVDGAVGHGSLLELRRNGEIVLNESWYRQWAVETDNTDSSVRAFVETSDDVEPIVLALDLYDAKQRYYEWLFRVVDERHDAALDRHDTLVAKLQSALS